MADDQEKSHHPTQKKLDDARRKGEVVRSQEINVTVVYLAYAACLFAFAPSAMQNTVHNLSAIWKEMTHQVGHTLNPLNTEALGRAIKSTAQVFTVFFISLPASVIIANIAQNSIIFVSTNIHPKISRVSLISGFKKKFGSSGFFEFFKNLTKSFLFCCAIYLSVKNNIDYFPSLSDLSFNVGFIIIFDVVKELTLAVVMISICISVIDYAWQKHTFTKKNMMSLQEMKDEFKDSEGDPHFKGMRRQRAIEISSQHMLKDVPQSDVVIVNPTHYSIALKWSLDSGTAPIIVALGVDHIALRIKIIAIENSVPIFEDIATARALTSTHNVGDEILPEHYAAVAAAIRFAQKTKGVSI